MNPLSHFENFARLAALARRVSSHQNIHSFTSLMLNAATLQHLPTALSLDSLTPPPQSEPLLRPHAIPIAPPRPPQTRAASF